MMYPSEQLMVEKSGRHTSKKWGLRRPTDTLAMSVKDWLTAQPNRNTPICRMTHNDKTKPMHMNLLLSLLSFTDSRADTGFFLENIYQKPFSLEVIYAWVSLLKIFFFENNKKNKIFCLHAACFSFMA